MICRICVALLLALPVGAAAQGTLRVAGPAGARDAPTGWHGGEPAHPLDALRALGADIETTEDAATVRLLGDTLEFALTSPFFRAGGRVRQLAAPVYAVGDTVFAPRQFFTEWLPDRHDGRVAFADDVLRLAGGGAGAPVADEGASDEGPAGEGADARAGAAGDRDRPAGAAERAEPPTRVVVLDPGHGGRDPGKPGPSGVNEKDFTLALSGELAEVLRRRGYEVHLTRTTDTLIGLYDRAPLANRWKAGRPTSVFVSIHANSFRSSSVRGFETYFLSEARTEDERRVAEMENAAIEFENGDPTPAADTLSHILNNLRNTYYVRASNDLAGTIQEALEPVHPGPNRGVKQAPFVVLVGAFMPAVLVEVLYASNPTEARLMTSRRFRERAAYALADAIDDFFDSHAYLSASGPDP